MTLAGIEPANGLMFSPEPPVPQHLNPGKRFPYPGTAPRGWNLVQESVFSLRVPGNEPGLLVIIGSPSPLCVEAGSLPLGKRFFISPAPLAMDCSMPRSPVLKDASSFSGVSGNTHSGHGHDVAASSFVCSRRSRGNLFPAPTTDTDTATFRSTGGRSSFELRRLSGLLHKLDTCPATLTGLEPATFSVTGRRANQLRHRAIS